MNRLTMLGRLAPRALLALGLAATFSSAMAGETPTAKPIADQQALDLVLWGVPAVNFERLFNAARAATGTQDIAVVYWSKPPTATRQTLTPNGETLAWWAFADGHGTGPMVLEIPPSGGAEVFGSVVDSWNHAITNLGLQGEDAGKGGKYLILPAGSDTPVPDGYIPIRLETLRFYVPLRIVPKSWSTQDLANAANYLKQVRFYPLSEAASRPATAMTDVSGVEFDSTIPYDLRFYEALAQVVRHDPLPPDSASISQALASAGIAKDKPFAPDAATASALTASAHAGKAWLENRLLNYRPPFYAGKSWLYPAERLASGGQGTFKPGANYGPRERAANFFMYDAPMKSLGTASFYLLGLRDKQGQLLEGGNSYHLHVPPNVPARQFWSLTAYDLDTMAFIKGSPRVSLSSFVEGLERNADGSVDLYLAPKAPAGKERNWIPTKPGVRSLLIFRFYRPDKGVADKSWQLPDIEALPSPASETAATR
ncbi:hypothetical protein D9M68_243960 [compost metagenome]|uniref:Uncharacterized conserved protein n=1 Tax=Pseudomonas jinjuensis TaxID=198616 RepID=A0A1H0D8N5_9PSED|nr:DUF1214 domain-containing protein [Pseudomonas jinjuensis]SDN66478.1 Uncharacterized conserved protein [Pseudomonas jinjuensis]